MISVLFVSALSLIIVGIGWPIVHKLGRTAGLSAVEHTGLAYLVGCFGVYFGVFLIGLYRLDAISMGALCLVMTALAAPGLKQIPWPSLLTSLRAAVATARDDKWLGFMWLTAIAVAASSMIQGLAPPNDYDSLMYHLSGPQYDLEIGRLSVPWDRGLGHFLFGAMGSNISRLALALTDAGAAQMFHGNWGLIAALGAWALARRLGFGFRVALGSAIMFLAIRVVIWEMATVETDVPLAAFSVFAMISYLAFRQSGGIGPAVLFGTIICGGILIKYQGFVVALAFAPLIGHDLVRRKISFPAILAGVFAAFAGKEIFRRDGRTVGCL